MDQSINATIVTVMTNNPNAGSIAMVLFNVPPPTPLQALQNTVQDLQQQFGAAQTIISGLLSNVSTLQANVSGLAGAQAALTMLPANVSNLETDITHRGLVNSSFCVMRNGGVCPPGFDSGSFQFDYSGDAKYGHNCNWRYTVC